LFRDGIAQPLQSKSPDNGGISDLFTDRSGLTLRKYFGMEDNPEGVDIPTRHATQSILTVAVLLLFFWWVACHAALGLASVAKKRHAMGAQRAQKSPPSCEGGRFCQD
jgi:hypothetical protein